MQLRGDGINNSPAPMYFVFGDAKWSVVDPDFTPQIEPVSKPTPAAYALSEEITVPASVYYQTKN